MSGPLRQYIGPCKARLKDLLATANTPEFTTFVAVDPTLPKADNVQHLRQQIFNTLSLLTKIDKAATQLDQKNSEWSQFMGPLTGDRLAAEEAIYEKTASGDDGFVTIAVLGHEKAIELDVRLKELELLISTLQSSSSTATGTEPSVHVEDSTPADSAQDRRRESASEASASGGSTPADGQSRAASPVPQQPQTHSGRIKLPKVELLSFGGNEVEFPSFWDMFNSAVHTQNISNVEKFIYLSSKLYGDAAKTIARFTPSNANYPLAVQALKDRFGNTRIIKQTLFRQLDRIPRAFDRVNDLQRTLDEIEAILGQLSTLGENLNQSSLVREIMKKFPHDVVLRVEEKHNDDTDWTMTELRQSQANVIRYKKRALVSAEMPSQGQQPFSNPRDRGQQRQSRNENYIKNYNKFPSPMNSPSGQNNVSRSYVKPRLPCLFCGDANHFSFHCDKYVGYENRSKRLYQLNVCQLCLKQGHQHSSCASAFSGRGQPCTYCKSNQHNKLVCPTRYEHTVSYAKRKPNIQYNKQYNQRSGTNNTWYPPAHQRNQNTKIFNNSKYNHPQSQQNRTNQFNITSKEEPSDNGDKTDHSPTQ